MKQLMIITTSLTLWSCTGQAQQTNPEQAIQQSLAAYVEAGDQNDAATLSQYMHQDFRVALYDAQEDNVRILDRSTYSNMIETKKLGGYQRSRNMQATSIIGDNMANVQVELTSPGKPTLKNFYSLVKTEGRWLVLQDFVVLIP